MSKELSKNKRLEIANVCYANVAGEFAYFTNPRYRGDNFTWDWFIEYCSDRADMWMDLNDVKGTKKLINETAKEFAIEIATRLVKNATE